MHRRNHHLKTPAQNPYYKYKFITTSNGINVEKTPVGSGADGNVSNHRWWISSLTRRDIVSVFPGFEILVSIYE